MRTPPVSLCIPTWNGAPFLPLALESAAAQSFGDFELLVVDDCSQDDSAKIASAFRDPRLRLLRNPQRLGIPGCWNRCLEEAQGGLVKFLFQDDVLAPRALEALRGALEREPEAVLAFGRRAFRYEGEGELPLRADGYQELLRSFLGSFRDRLTGLELVRGALRSGRELTVNVVGEPSFVLLRKEAVRRAGGFDPAFAQLVDWELWLRLGRRGALAFVDEELGVFRVHAESQSVANRSGLRMPQEFVRLLVRIRELYRSELEASEGRKLRRAEWRYRRRLAAAVLRAAGGRLGCRLRGVRDGALGPGR